MMSERKIGKYTIVGEIGKGAMGIVYKAIDPYIGRTVAIKTIRFDVVGQRFAMEEAQTRFMREARSAGNLSHPNIVTIYEVGEDEGLTYIAMEYIDGQSLEDFIASRRKFSLEEIINLIRLIGDALECAHQKGIIHRDVKPGNILIDSDGRPYIVDFGIARLSSSTMTQANMVMGTPFYMSPEQISGKTVDSRSDIFSLGGILYELITRHKPFPGDTVTTVIYRIINEDPTPVRSFQKDLPEGLEYVVRKALAKSPESRYQSCREFIEDLRNYPRLTQKAREEMKKAAAKKEPAREAKKVEKEEKKAKEARSRRKHRPVFISLAFLAAAAAGVFLFIILPSLKKGPPPRVALAEPQASAAVPAEKFSEQKIDEREPTIRNSSQSRPRTEEPVPDKAVQAPLPSEKKKEIPKKPATSSAAVKEKESVRVGERLEEGTKAIEQGDYERAIGLFEDALRIDPMNERAQKELARAKKEWAEKQKSKEIEDTLAAAVGKYDKGDFQESLKLLRKILILDPGHEEAMKYMERASLKLVPGEIRVLVDEYIQAVQDKRVTAFYGRYCSPDLFQKIKTDTERSFALYDQIKAAASNVAVHFKDTSPDRYQIEASFHHVITGLSLKKKTRQILFEGIYKWSLEKMGGQWTITEIAYETKQKKSET
ncbi:MAG: protein kinase [Candidatus Aminicenantales bacterium]